MERTQGNFLPLKIFLIPEKSVLPGQNCSKSRTLVIFCQKMAIYHHYPCFIAFLCGNELVKNPKMAILAKFLSPMTLQNHGLGDKSPHLATLLFSLKPVLPEIIFPKSPIQTFFGAIGDFCKNLKIAEKSPLFRR